MRHAAAAAAAAVAAVALAATACGGGGGGASLPAGASKAPADAVGFVSLKADTSTEQWRQATKLAAKFPALAPQLVKLERYRRALGSEVDYVWLDFANNGDDGVLLTKPRNLARLKTLLAPDTSSYSSLGDGWVAVGDYAATFKRRARSDHLDRDKDFKAAFGNLDDAAAVRAWARGGPVQSALDRELAGGGAAPRITHDLGDLKALAGFGRAESDGARLELRGTIDPAPDAATFKPTLPDSTPGGAVLYVSSTHLDAPTRAIIRMVADSKPNFEPQLKQVEGVLGLTLQDDVYPLLKDESAVALYRGGRIPQILFEQKVGDEAKADSLLRRIGAIAQASGDVEVATTQIGGTTMQTLTFSRSAVTVYDGVAKGRILVTNSRRLAQDTITGPGQKLSDDPQFRAARDAAKLPGEVAAFAYGDLRNGLPYAFEIAQATGSTVTASDCANTKPLQNALVYLVKDGDDLKLSGFTTIK